MLYDDSNVIAYMAWNGGRCEQLSSLCQTERGNLHVLARKRNAARQIGGVEDGAGGAS